MKFFFVWYQLDVQLVPNLATNLYFCQLSGNYIYGPRKFSIAQKIELAKVVSAHKEIYDKEVSKNNKRFDPKKRRWVTVRPTDGCFSKAVREFFRNLKDVPHNDRKFINAVAFARRCYESYQNSDDEPSKKRFRREGGGRKAHAPEFRDELFEWFIDVRGALKGKCQLFKFCVGIWHIY